MSEEMYLGKGTPSPRIIKPLGVTESERELAQLCSRSFLSLWSYPSVFRDQGRQGSSGDGKEVCDLLVVFGDNVVIFSDKHCRFPHSDNLELDWQRWFRRAILASANQVWGAERWIRDHSTKLFLDRACTIEFPLELPNPDRIRVFRVVVAHDSGIRCRETIGGSGSLMIVPDIEGSTHLDFGKGGIPFSIGQIDHKKGYVHVLDDVSLKIVLSTLDTISDFIDYLKRKEAFISSGRLACATGEEDLLAYYLKKVNALGEHDFVVPDYAEKLIIEPQWDNFKTSRERNAQIEADKISYFWDSLIEHFSQHIVDQTYYQSNSRELSEQEKLLRVISAESRFRRRLLSEAFLGVIRTVTDRDRLTRVVWDRNPNTALYVFLTLNAPTSKPYEEYRNVRVRLLQACCYAAKLRFPNALDIVWIATDQGHTQDRSEDALYLDCRKWTVADEQDARTYVDQWNLLKNTNEWVQRAEEYPLTSYDQLPRVSH